MYKKTATSHLVYYGNTAAHPLFPSIAQFKSFPWMLASLFFSAPWIGAGTAASSGFRLCRHPPYQSPPQRITPQFSGFERKVSMLMALAITMAAAALFEDGTIVLSASLGASFSRRR